MTNTRRWPLGPWIELIRTHPDDTWSYIHLCGECGDMKEIWYFRHQGPVGANSHRLCKACGDAAYQMQQMDRTVNG